MLVHSIADVVICGKACARLADPVLCCAQLRALLLSLPQRKWVFTNCSEAHCRAALSLLGLQVRAGACACVRQVECP